MNKKYVLLIILLIFTSFLCFFILQERRVTVVCTEDSDFKISAFTADTYSERVKGLMFVEDLPPREGMLFVFDADVKDGFWMKNTLIPLDMLFIDREKRIIWIKREVQPCKTDTCEIIQPEGMYRYVLEVNAGVSSKLEVGDSLSW